MKSSNNNLLLCPFLPHVSALFVTLLVRICTSTSSVGDGVVETDAKATLTFKAQLDVIQGSLVVNKEVTHSFQTTSAFFYFITYFTKTLKSMNEFNNS